MRHLSLLLVLALFGCNRDFDGDGAALGTDCDDLDPNVNPSVPEVMYDGVDNDCDPTTPDDDLDGDGDEVVIDCDDTNPLIHGRAWEVCNGIDDDCDGVIDDDVDSVWYTDADGDGQGDPATAQHACTGTSGQVGNADDCDDANDGIYDGAIETCDGVDEDCDGVIDNDAVDLGTYYLDADSDGYGDPSEPVDACTATDGLVDDATDCDDTKGAVNPGATEVCNGVDDNCDTKLDDLPPVVPMFADTDNDGAGDPNAPWTSCEAAPGGYVGNDTDCDDGDPTLVPGADELCDGVDQDCDGVIDDNPTGAPLWFTDFDQDGFGVGLGVASCSAPAGTAALAGDCDDATKTTSPSGTETCNGVDDDCDGTIDDNATNALSWYADLDKDGQGDVTKVTLACSAPIGSVADDRDCNDADANAFVGGTEVCGGGDENCDGNVDESTASNATLWYVDADTDGYGSATSTRACARPANQVAITGDCDDAKGTTHPGAPDNTWNDVDDDCDAKVDEDTWLGRGADGALTVSGAVDLSTKGGGAYAVASITGASLVTTVAPAGLAANDEVLILNLHGTDAARASVGTWEFRSVASVVGTTITLQSPIQELFGQTTNSVLTGQSIVVLRVPNFTSVTVNAASTLSVPAWNGTIGGVLAFRANGTVSVANTGSIHVDGRGYAGGATGTIAGNDAFQGESYAGSGDGNGLYNNLTGAWVANYGGGGAYITGGGGNYAGGATPGASWNPPGSDTMIPAAGLPYGQADLALLLPGSGGGGVWRPDGVGTCNSPGPGGNGAGVVYVAANAFVASGVNALSATGGTTTACASGSFTYGAGGGSGGTVWLVTRTATLPAGSVDALGGAGRTGMIRNGGNGGYGRVRVDYDTVNGQVYNSVAAVTALAGASDPDPGFVAPRP